MHGLGAHELAAAIGDLVAIVPSETLILTASVIASDGDGLLWGLIALSSALGALAGDNILYLLGDRFGTPALGRVLRSDRAEERLEWSRDQLQRRPWVIVAIRFLPGGRTASARSPPARRPRRVLST